MKTPDNFDTLIREALKRSNAAEPQHSLPADFADRVMARIQAEKVVPFYRRRPVWLSIAAAAVIAAAVGIFFLTQPLDKPTIAQTATPAPAASDSGRSLPRAGSLVPLFFSYFCKPVRMDCRA